MQQQILEQLPLIGKVDFTGSQLQYELIRGQKSNFLNFYDRQGTCRFSQNIFIPPFVEEVHIADYYIVGFGKKDGMKGRVWVKDMGILLGGQLQCQMNLKKNEKNSLQNNYIKSIIFNQKVNLIFLSDYNNTIHYLMITKDKVIFKTLYKSPTKYTEMFISSKFDLILFDKNSQKLISVKFDWNNDDKLIEVTQRKLVADYYSKDGFEVVVQFQEQSEIFKRQQMMEVEGEEIVKNSMFEKPKFWRLDIDNGKYEASVKSNCNLTFISGQNYLIIFDTENHQIFSIHESVFGIIDLQSPLPEQLSSSNILPTFTKKLETNITVMYLNVFDPLTATSNQYRYEIGLIAGKEHEVFLKRHVGRLFQKNGLIDPAFQDKVKEVLCHFDVSFQFSRRSDKIPKDQRNSSIIYPQSKSILELGKDLLKICLLHCPTETYQMLLQLKRYKESEVQTIALQRYVIYCKKILEQIQIDIMVRKSLLNIQKFEYIESNQDDEVRKFKILMRLVQNMVGFLEILIGEFVVPELRQLAGDKGQQMVYNKSLEKSNWYRKVQQTAKSQFLILSLISDPQIYQKISTFSQNLLSRKQQNQYLYSTNQQSKILQQSQIKPFVTLQYFSNWTGRMLDVNYFFSLLENCIGCYYQVAYLYFCVCQEGKIVPYLSRAETQLFEGVKFGFEFVDGNDAKKLSECRKKLEHLTAIAVTGEYLAIQKYLIHLSLYYNTEKLLLSILNCGNYNPRQSQKSIWFQQHKFVVQALVICGKVDLANLYIRKKEVYCEGLVLFLFEIMAGSGYFEELLEWKAQNFIRDDELEELTKTLETKMSSEKYEIARSLFY